MESYNISWSSYFEHKLAAMIITALAMNFICSRELATEIGDGAVHRYILDGVWDYILYFLNYLLFSAVLLYVCCYM